MGGMTSMYRMLIPTQYTWDRRGKSIARRNETVLKCRASVTQYRYKRWVMSSQLSHRLAVMWLVNPTHMDSTRSVLPITTQAVVKHYFRKLRELCFRLLLVLPLFIYKPLFLSNYTNWTPLPVGTGSVSWMLRKPFYLCPVHRNSICSLVLFGGFWTGQYNCIYLIHSTMYE